MKENETSPSYPPGRTVVEAEEGRSADLQLHPEPCETAGGAPGGGDPFLSGRPAPSPNLLEEARRYDARVALHVQPSGAAAQEPEQHLDACSPSYCLHPCAIQVVKTIKCLLRKCWYETMALCVWWHRNNSPDWVCVNLCMSKQGGSVYIHPERGSLVWCVIDSCVQ